MSDVEITVLIPAYNEAGHIGATLAGLRKSKYPLAVTVIDDCSGDETAAVAGENQARVIRLSRNEGKGGALNHGLAEVRGGIVALIDADLGDSAAEIDKLLQPVVENKTDMSIAQFGAFGKKGGFGIATAIARMGLKITTGMNFKSPMSGQRVLRYEVLEAIRKKVASGFGVEVGLTIDVFRAGFRIKEVPVKMTHAETGRDFPGFLHRGRQCLDIVTVLIRKWVNR
ncbi:MAG: glycosyltransferase family 2 protein [Bacillota bacterium]